MTGIVLASVIPALIARGASEPVASQTASPQTRPTAPRTPWDDPDLAGIWNYSTNTPLERPAEWAGRESLTAEEVAATNLEWSTFATEERRSELTPEYDLSLNFNQFWWDIGTSTGRTSLITDPANGRLPPLTPERQAYEETAEAQRLQQVRWGLEPARGLEDLELNDRCIVDRQVPILPSSDNDHVRILQSPEYVVILLEKIHDARFIPLTGAAELPDHVRQWLGVSRGHWDGPTLVVETTNFHPQADFMGSGADRHVIERFTRLGEHAIEYSFTVTDPTVWTRPWSATVPWHSAEGPIFEYACHEGNYSLAHMLSAGHAIESGSDAEVLDGTPGGRTDP